MDLMQNIRLDKYLSESVKQRASDLHLVIGSKPTIRVDKELVPLEEEELVNEEMINEIISGIATNEQRSIIEREKELRIIYNFSKVRCIINIYYQRAKPSISVKLISMNIATIEELSLPKIFSYFTELKKGLVLLSGAYYSGRTTSLIALLENINQNKKRHILTLENPIEHVIFSKESIVEQREIGSDVKNFEKALGEVMESDVDVLAMFQMPLDANIKSIIELGEAILVLGVINADSVVEALDKLLICFREVELQAARNMITEALEGIVVQKLIPRIGGGLVPVFETIRLTEPIKALIRDGKYYNIKNILLNSTDENLVSFDRSLAELVKRGEVQYDTAYQESSDRDLFQSLVRK